MADRYWVLGTGTWDSTSTTNWSASSGGVGGASVPTAADNVFFDVNSNVGTTAFTVTMATTPRVCNDFTASGLDGVMTLAGTAIGLTVSGSLTFQATNFTRTYSGTTTFNATTTGKTVTTNGVAFGGIVDFNGVGGGWTLGSAFSSGASTLSVTNGTFDTSSSGNYAVTAAILDSNVATARTINLNTSTITLSGGNFVRFTTPTNLTFNAGTSTINGSNASATFAGGGQTFYNVAFTSTALSAPSITGANTFNNLSITGRTTVGIGVLSLSANQTINGPLTVSAGTASAYRIQISSDTFNTTRTLTCAAVSLTDVDFRDITIAGAASPASGTRLGDCKGNSGITFDAAKTVYYTQTGSADWGTAGSLGAWSITSGGSPNGNRFPLAQDTAVFPAATYPASGSTTTINASYNIGTIDMSLRTSNTMTLAHTITNPTIYGNWINGTGTTNAAGNNSITFAGRTTQQITSSGRAFTQAIVINTPSGSVQLQDDFTNSATNIFTLTAGTLSLQSFKLATSTFSSSNSNTRTISFGTGNITCIDTGTVWTTATVTGLTTTGTQVVNVTSTGSTAITVSSGVLSETNSISFNFTGGTYPLTFLSSSNYSARNIDFTGYAGTLGATGINATIYGNLKFSTGMTLTAGANSWAFSATSGTQQITTNAKTLDFALNFSGVGGTFQLQDALTMGSTRIAQLTNGTLDLFGKTLTVGSTFQTATGTKNLTFNGGTLVCPTASTTAFNNAQPTGFTTTAGTGTGTISMTGATAKTFVGAGSTFNCTLNQGGAGDLTITGSNTFSNITNTVQPASVLFTAATTSTFSNFSLSGTAGNLITIGSVTATRHTLSKASGTVSADYLSISRSTATGGAGWYAGANSTNGGNNSGWIFTAPPVNGTANVTGVQATGQVGTVTASGGTVLNGDAYPTGVQAISAVGTVTASGDASNNLTGVQSTGTVGITTATGEANTGLTGVQSTGAVGTTTANGDGQTNLTGVQATGAVGIVTATGGGTGAGNAYVIGVEAIGSVGNVTANGGGYPVWPNGGLGYPFIIEPDRINPSRNATANVKPAYILSAVGKVSAFGTIVINANVSVQAILHEIKINSMSARGIQNPTDEELIALLLMH